MTYEELKSKAFTYWLRTGIRIDIEKIFNSIEYKSLLKEIDFTEEVSNGTILFIGEGNFSFSLSLASKSPNKKFFISSIFESEKEISEQAIGVSQETKQNAKKLEELGSTVLYNINAEKLDTYFKKLKFDRIIFNFPNVASREGKYGKTENHYLVKNFLKSSSNILKQNGKVIISMVNTPYYKGVFDFESLKLTNYEKPKIYKFNPENYKGYTHTMTHKDEPTVGDSQNGLERMKNFISIVFTLK